MSGSEIRRADAYETLIIASGAAPSTELDMTGFAGGMIKVPGAWTAADIGFSACEKSGGTFVDLQDELGARVKITGVATATSMFYDIPPEVFSARYVKLESINTSTEAAVNQGAERSIIVVMKT